MSFLLKRWIRRLDRFLCRCLISYRSPLPIRRCDDRATRELRTNQWDQSITKCPLCRRSSRSRIVVFLRCRGRYWATVQRWGGPPCLVQRCTGDVDLHREVMNKLSLLSRCLWKVVVIVVLEQNSFNTADVQVLEFCALIRDWWVGKRQQSSWSIHVEDICLIISIPHTSIESNIVLGRHFPNNYFALAIALSMSHFLSDTVGDLRLQITRPRCSSRRPMDYGPIVFFW